MIQSVDRALTILEILTRASKSMALGDLSQAADLPKSTTRRLLRTLIQHNLVRQDASTSEYTPGLQLFEMAYQVLSRMEIRTQALPIVEQLSRQTNLTVHLAILDEGEVVYIDKREADSRIRMYSAVGKRAPAHCTGVGKVLLAYLPEDEVRRVVNQYGLTRYTAHTITTWDELTRHLAAIRARGYALDCGEYEEIIRCVAVPIRDHRDCVVAAVSLTSTVNYLNLEQAEQLSGLLLAAGKEISRQIGYTGSSL